MFKSNSKSVLAILTTGFLSISSIAQITPDGAYLIGDHVEIGINNHGHEGTQTLPGSNARSTSGYPQVFFGFVANPQTDGWVNYDGDFFTPGTPENGFGIEVNGVNYSNNGADATGLMWPPILQYEIPGAVANYEQQGDCISAEWTGTVSGVQVKLTYSLNTTQLYYTTDVEITNTTASTMNDVYFYRNLDPDNNQFLTGNFGTFNTIVSQPVSGCEKALVSATQSAPWTSYIGLAAIGSNFRVTYGGFSNRDGSDIWNGIGFSSAPGSTLTDDCAISLAYKIATLPAGATENFQFSVILDQNQIDAAIASLYFFDFVGGSGSPASECEPEVDTVFTCAGIPATITVEGPNIGDYNWSWSPATDLNTTTGTTVQSSTNSTITYTVTGTPTGTCIGSPIIKTIVVDLTAGPEIEIIDPGPQCGSFDLNDLVVNDINNTPGTITDFYAVIPDSADQTAGTWPGSIISPGDVVYVVIADPIGGCFAYEQVIIDFGGSGAAGADSTLALCNLPGATYDLDNFLDLGVTPSGDWSETSMPASGQFNATSGVFNPNNLAGTYTFNYLVPGVGGCPDDIATMTITLFAQPNADFEYIVNGQSSANGLTSVCITNPINFDNNSTVGGGGASIISNDWDYGNGFGSTVTNPTYQYPTTGTFNIELTVTTNQGCVDTWTMPITINTVPTMALNVGLPACYGFTDGSLTVNTAGGGPYTYIISDASGTQINNANTNTVNNIGSGWYYLNVDDGNGCAGIDSVFIPQPDPIDIDLQITQPLCYGYNTGLAVVDTVFNYTGNYNQVSYFWNPNPNGTNGLGQDSSVMLPPGTYSLTINDIQGCSNVFDFTIAYPDSLYFVELGAEPASCRVFPYQNGQGVVYAAASGDNPNYSYTWTNLQTGATTHNTTWGGLNPGNYEILVLDYKGCSLTTTVTVGELSPAADFEMTSPEFTSNYFGTAPVNVHFVNMTPDFKNPNDPLAEATYYWHFGFEGQPWTMTHDSSDTYDFTYTEGGTYEVCLVALNHNGCLDTFCKPLIIYNALKFVPVNVFTPNGDGANDLFSFVEYAKGVKMFSCVIVNRWGTVVHEMTAVTDTWDGTDMSGSKCNDGVYFYNYTGSAENGTLFEGQGTLEILDSK